MLSLLPRERAPQPIVGLVEAIARRRTGRLDVPVAVAHLLKAKLVRHLQILNVTNALRPQIEYEITVPHVQQTTRGRAVESESDLGGGHRLRKILLVGEDLACLVLEMRLEEKGVCLQATNRPTFFPKRLQSG